MFFCIAFVVLAAVLFMSCPPSGPRAQPEGGDPYLRSLRYEIYSYPARTRDGTYPYEGRKYSYILRTYSVHNPYIIRTYSVHTPYILRTQSVHSPYVTVRNRTYITNLSLSAYISTNNITKRTSKSRGALQESTTRKNPYLMRHFNTQHQHDH